MSQPRMPFSTGDWVVFTDPNSPYFDQFGIVAHEYTDNEQPMVSVAPQCFHGERRQGHNHTLEGVDIVRQEKNVRVGVYDVRKIRPPSFTDLGKKMFGLPDATITDITAHSHD